MRFDANTLRAVQTFHVPDAAVSWRGVAVSWQGERIFLIGEARDGSGVLLEGRR